MVKDPSLSVEPKWAEHDRRLDQWNPDRQDLKLLIEMNAQLASQPVPDYLCHPRPEHLPMLLPCGTTRSGKTLLHQLLANAFELTYPDNVSARLWGAPYHAIAVSNSVREQMGWDGNLRYESVTGFSPDVFGPHEFSYFWSRFFPLGEQAFLTDEDKANCDEDRLLDELAATFKMGGGKPLMFAAMNFTINADYFSRLFKDALFIDMWRNPTDITLSLLRIRQERYGREDVWWGANTPERPNLEKLEPEAQAAGQIHYLRRYMEKGLAEIPTERHISIDYAELCNSPRDQLEKIREAAAGCGITLESRKEFEVPDSFPISGGPAPGQEERYERLEKLLENYAENSEAAVIAEAEE